MKPTPYLKQILSEIAQHANSGRLQADGKSLLSEGKFRPTKKSLRERALGEAGKPEEDTGDELDTALDSAKDVPAEAPPPPAKKDAPAPKAPAAPAPAAPEASADTAEKEAQAKQAQADAASAEADVEKAKADTAQAEKDVVEQGHIKLGSVPGISFLLTNVITPALRDNTLDGLAQKFVDGLKIDDAQKMEAFKQETTLFRKVKGFQQLVDSMSTIVGAPTSAEASQEG
jgi:type IV secretory pathway VirB10-like protein